MWKKRMVGHAAIVATAALLLSGCGTAAETQNKEGTESSSVGSGEKDDSQTIDKVTWFSDVNFWNPPTKWDTTEGTVTGGITKATGLEFEMNIPAEDGATKLALMIINQDLPDVMSITDSNTIKELTESGLVWNLEEFLTQYDPESHLLNGGYPEDVKELQIERDGAWYAFASHMNSEDSRKIFPPCDEYYAWNIEYGENYGILWNDTVLAEFGLTTDDLRTEEQVLAAFEMIQNTDKTVDGASYIPILVDGNMYQDATLRTLEYFFGSMPIDDNGNYRTGFRHRSRNTL